MGSRLRDNVKHIFECFCEVAGPQGKEPAWILQKYPSTYKDESVLKNVPKFAYPCKIENTCIEYYSFVFTDLDSKWTFGYCRHDPNSATTFVILSYLPWHESFYKLLNCIAQITNNNATGTTLWTFLDKILQADVPDFGMSVRVTSNLTEFTCQAPKQFQLPSIPENKNLTEYCAIDPVNMLQIFASMLYERRILITSKRLSRLSACVQAANSVIYPMSWQHIFIPVLPHHLIDYLNAPMPYLIGLPGVLLDSIRLGELGDIVMLNADTNVLTTPHNDLSSLPQDVITTLKRQLRNKSTGDGVSRAFLRALVQLIGGYRDALKFHQGEKITFSREAFVESRPPSMQPFLRKMLDLQIFQQFIEERLDMLNAGLGFSDEFELEACNYMDKSSGTIKQQYKEWLHTVRKEGASFFKTVKSRVRERGKDVRIAYKGLRSRLKEEKQGEEKSTSAPSSPTHLRKKDISMPLQSNKYSALDLASSPDLSPLDINLDLMSDLQHVIFKDCSPTSVQKTLMGADNSIAPPPIPKSKPPEPDLIRLDSISSMDDVLPTPSQCTGVENPLYPYFVPKSQEDEAGGSASFKQNLDFFNQLSISSSSMPTHKAFSFSEKSSDLCDSSVPGFDFLTSSTLLSQNGGIPSSILSNVPSEPLQYTPPKVLSTFISPSQPPVPSPRKLSNTETKLPHTFVPARGPLSASYNASYKPPLKNGFLPSSSSIIKPEAKDIIASILNNNSSYPSLSQSNGFSSSTPQSNGFSIPQTSNGPYPTIPTHNGAFVSRPSSSTYTSRAAFLNDQLGPAVPSIGPKKSVSEWTKFE